MQRYALGIEYQGSQYHGWQRQETADSVQARLESALSTVADKPITVMCAGRTDKGVHAANQVVHFDTDAFRDDRAWTLGTNTHLPPDIRVRWIKSVSNDFHARFSAYARQYQYFIYNHDIAPGILNGCITWHYPKLDVSLMQEAANAFIGEHDFSSFRAAECQAKSPIRTVHDIEITRYGHLICITLSANAFLHNMVRIMTGVLMEIGKGRQPVSWASEVLAAKSRKCSGVTASPQGLYLTAVSYPDEFSIPSASRSPWFFSKNPNLEGITE